MKFGVYGLGRFGQFWGKLLSSEADVVGYNRSDRAVVPEIVPGSLADLGACDVVFLCTAISSMPEVCASLAPHLAPDTIVADTCSVKVYPVRVMERLIPVENKLLPLHPMFGPDSAGSSQAGLPLVMCTGLPGRSPDKPRVDSLRAAFVRLGMRIIDLSPDEHDREAARTQGITHFIGRFLSDIGIEPSPISTLGYRKIFEVMEQTCNDPWQLFIDLQRFNPYTPDLRNKMNESFQKLMGILSELTENSDGL